MSYTGEDYTPAQIMAGISLALRDGDMEAAASLICLLAVKDPRSAQTLVSMIDLIREAD